MKAAETNNARAETRQRTITDIEGVYASGIHCGIKRKALDLAFIHVPNCAASAAAFTRNKFHAPCIAYSRERAGGAFRAAIVNSGNANAATGKAGYRDARETAERAAAALGIKPDEVAVASTGIIGVPLPMDKLRAGLDRILADPTARRGDLAARAIMTTDTRSKEIFLEKRIGGARVAVAGFAKGSGMIAPNMGTMLAFLATDARVSPGELQSIFSEAVDDTFNMVSVDGDTSTNDMAMIFSTGARDIGGQLDALARLIADACAELAKMIAADGEGAEKLIAIRVRGAADRAQARRIAMNVVGSPLVKTAIHGADPNWGRIIAAAGKDPAVEIDPDRLVLTLQGIAVFRRGAPVAESLKPCAERLREKTIDIDLKLNQGDGRARAWGCDLTHGYIDINTQYS